MKPRTGLLTIITLMLAATFAFAEDLEMMPYAGFSFAPVLSSDSNGQHTYTPTGQATSVTNDVTITQGFGFNAGGAVGLAFFQKDNPNIPVRFDVEVAYQYIPGNQMSGGAKGANTILMMGPNIYVGFPSPLENSKGYAHAGYALGEGQLLDDTFEMKYDMYKIGFGLTRKLNKNVEVDAGYRFVYLKGEDEKVLRTVSYNHDLVMTVRYVFY